VPGLYLNCGLCGRKQADGLLSRAAWAHVEVNPGTVVRACPTCRTTPDWEQRLRGEAQSS
jgi:hypothetical protein